ncbi:MAG: Protein ChrB, N-terminal [Tepidanaerobacteraceae bacterium]|nr:Protein ChrB, N-terminal [Tepidanaerobacteraceae bacterium]
MDFFEEVKSQGSEVHLFVVKALSKGEVENLIELFNDQRNKEYEELIEKCNDFLKKSKEKLNEKILPLLNLRRTKRN